MSVTVNASLTCWKPFARVARGASAAVQFHAQQLKLAPGKPGEQFVWVLPFEVAARTGVGVAARWGGVLRVEGHARRRVGDEDPVALRGAGDHQRELRQVQRFQLE